MKSLRDMIMEQSSGKKFSKRSWFFGLENADDVNRAISKALDTVELERDNDGAQRKELARKIQNDGIKIQKMASKMNSIENDMCLIDHEIQLEVETIKMTQSIQNEISEIVDLIENCSSEKLPSFKARHKG